MPDVTIRQLPEGGADFIVFEGSLDGEPEATQRRSVKVSALKSGDLTVEGEKQRLRAAVEQAAAQLAFKRSL